MSDEAKIDEGDTVIRQHQKISRMGIGLIKAEFENLLEEIVEKEIGCTFDIHIRFEQPVDIIKTNAIDIIHDENMGMREVPVGLWREDIGIAGKVLRKARHVGRFQNEIELLVNGRAKLLDHLERIKGAAF